jgi:hypothetical protein
VNVIIGKRTTVGAAITSTAAVLSHYFPAHAPAIVAAAVPITFVLQVLIAAKFGVTQK